MPMNEALKAQIDSLTYEELLRSMRFAPAGDPRWCGEEGQYRMDRMHRLLAEGADHVGASKRIGVDHG